MELTRDNKRDVMISLFGGFMRDALVADGVEVGDDACYCDIADLFMAKYFVKIGGKNDMADVVKTYIDEEYSERMAFFDDVDNKDARDLASWSVKYHLCKDSVTMNTNRFMESIADEFVDKNRKFYHWRWNTADDDILVFVDWGDTNYWIEDLRSKETSRHTILTLGIAKFQKIDLEKR